MCTLTIGRTHQSLLVTVNRDESRTREDEMPPQIFGGGSANPISWVAPLDGRSGGTWVAANNRGVVACLLNLWPDGYDPSPQPRTISSRGRIIPELMEQGDLQDCRQWLRTRLDPHRFEPFRLVAADSEEAFSVTWPGAAKGAARQSLTASIGTVPNQKWTLFCSSSYKPGPVSRWRKELFDAWLKSSSPFQAGLPSIHLYHSDSKAGWGPLVNRRGAQTRSITQIEIAADGPRVELRYWSDPWKADGSAPSNQISLPMASLAREAQGS